MKKQDFKIGDDTNFGIITSIKENSVCFGKNKVGVDVWYKKADVKLENKQETTTEEEHNYLQGFIDQFEENGERQELSNADWNVSGFLEWLKHNNFKLVKRNYEITY